MKIACTLALIALAATSLAAHAQEATGRVRGVYVEAARGVLVDPRMSRGSSARRWADVELNSGDHRRALVMIPSDMKVATGDLVGVRIAPENQKIASLEPLPVSRVTRVESSSQLALPGIGSD